MARKKRYDPRQLTFLFDVMADQIENLKREETDSPKKKEAYHDRRAGTSVGDRKPRSKAGNNPDDPTGFKVSQFSLFGAGSVGAEPTGRIEEPGKRGSGRIRPETEDLRAGRDGDGSSEFRDGGASTVDGDERLGDFGDARHRYPRENYRITLGTVGVGGATAKFSDNLKAIQLVKQLESHGVLVASPEEKEILVRYVGWGGLPQAFDATNPDWREQGETLRQILSDSEYAKARRSTQDAHYTSETVVQGIYDGLARLGVSSKPDTPPFQILEPSAGIGNFIGLCPPELRAKFTAIEQDAISVQISKYLYPEARHIQDRYQGVSIRPEEFDITLGNPPFGSQRLFDPKHLDLSKFSIHNYFLAKSIDKLREGGIAAFVVSRFFMDAVDSSAREHIANNAELLGAIRLPETAFRQNALTDVTTDIVFFQKQTLRPTNKDWVEATPYSVWNPKERKWEEAAINRYFADHPKQMIGELVKSGGAFREALNCVANEDIDLSAEITKRLEVLPEGVFEPRTRLTTTVQETSSLNESFIASPYFQNLKEGAFCKEPLSGTIVYKTPGDFGSSTYKPVELKRDSEHARLSAIIGIRDSLRELLTAEKDVAADLATLSRLRHHLNTRYDGFIKKFGLLNSSTNRSIFREDPESSLVQSLELEYDKGLSKEAAKRTGREARPSSAKKAAIFRQRVLSPVAHNTYAESVQDALILCLRETGKVNFSRIGELVSMAPDDAQKELQQHGLAFLNPATNEWEIKDKYLTGNVREKLRTATEASKDNPQFIINVAALQAAMPPEIEAIDIGVQFGATWIPDDVMNIFFEEVIHNGSGDQRVKYMPALGKWNAKISIYDTTLNTSVWGIPEYPASRLIESLLKGTPIKVEKESGQRDEAGNPIMVVDQDLTAAAMQKADEIKQAFKDWIWKDDERRQALTKIYNERFNTHVPPSYNGQHIELVNANDQVKLRPHQKDVIWRSIQEGTGLFDHVVGAGKTLACIAAVMESRRMGFMKKPMIVVPNHLVYQWRDEFFKLYPAANILVAEKDDLTKRNRERFFSRIATGEWDAVVVAHSSFKKIEMPRETQKEILIEQIESMLQAIKEAKEAQGSRATIKQLEKQRERMTERYEAMLAKGGEKDKAVDFSDLGVDGLFVDESQEFKNLGFATTMNVSGLGNIAGSSKALDLFIKCRYLQKKHDGRGVFFLTGTPISNSIAEVYTLQRYLQYDQLVAKQIEHFDAWASTFGQITAGWELDATGVNYKLKSRFASFQNVPELLSMYRTFADVITKKDLDDQAKEANLRIYTPPMLGGSPRNLVMPRSADQGAYMGDIIYRMEHLPKDARIDNPLKITNDARKAGLDYRLIDPSAGDFAGSKVNAAVDRIFKIWQDTSSVKGTQLVFCDLSTPKGGGMSMQPSEPPSLSVGDDDLVEAQDDDEANVVPDMDDMVAVQGGNFSVYDDMRRKLIDRGIPANQIAFIHEANTDLRKSKLFAEMQSGQVRILFGSTSKMGAGTNVQKRLVAAHHLDAPWRPSDLEQRNGRILRQGNVLYERDPDNFKVEVNYYATKQTYDARMWQTIEYKAAAIEQFRKGDLAQRVIDDVSSEAANAAEMKAAASGNPLILMQVKLASDLRKLEALNSQYQRTQHRLQDRLRWLQSGGERFEAAKAAFEANVSLRNANTSYVMEKGEKKIRLDLYVNGKIINGEANKKKLHDYFVGQIQRVPTLGFGKELPIGKYRGFELSVVQRLSSESRNFQFSLKGAKDFVLYPKNLEYVFGDKLSLSGLFQRIDNVLDKGLLQQFDAAKQLLEQEKSELRNVEASLTQDFPHLQELELTRENHTAVMRELKKMQEEPSYVSEWTPKKLAPENQEHGGLEENKPHKAAKLRLQSSRSRP